MYSKYNPVWRNWFIKFVEGACVGVCIKIRFLPQWSVHLNWTARSLAQNYCEMVKLQFSCEEFTIYCLRKLQVCFSMGSTGFFCVSQDEISNTNNFLVCFFIATCLRSCLLIVSTYVSGLWQTLSINLVLLPFVLRTPLKLAVSIPTRDGTGQPGFAGCHSTSCSDAGSGRAGEQARQLPGRSCVTHSTRGAGRGHTIPTSLPRMGALLSGCVYKTE